jgi:glycogen synthase
MLGVGSITTDLAGFGRYICNECQQGNIPGIYILQRLGKTDVNVTKQLTQALLRFTKYTKHERIENKISARKVAETANWEAFIVHYIDAHNKAIDKLLS